eukprot:31134-Pelagococcus_subviridis.AAC.4
MRPISPPRASTSCTSWDFAGPPTAGLHGCHATRSSDSVRRSVRAPFLALASAASHPAWPAPTTMTS